MVLNIKGGKTTSLKDKKPKKEERVLDEADLEFQRKQKADEAARKALINKLNKK